MISNKIQTSCIAANLNIFEQISNIKKTVTVTIIFTNSHSIVYNNCKLGLVSRISKTVTTSQKCDRIKTP